jgi:soluble lytic murein transglycosylase-like protein
MRIKIHLARLLAIISFLACCGSALYGQVYSYLDANGVRIFTNIPPSGQIQDLKISGAPLPSPAPAPAQVKKNAVAAPSKPGVSPKSNAIAKTIPQPTQVLDSGAYDKIIARYADEFSLDPKLLQSMIATESGFNPYAVSPKGAQGLMQLMPETAARLGVTNPFDPEDNISGGARYMRFLLDTFADRPEDNLILSLAAYNAGENLVQKLGRIPNIRETNDYVSSIIRRYGRRTMDVPATSAPAISTPSTFRYLDEKGVLILTNIPPVDRSRNANATGGSNSVSR